jgi:translocation and assembly module TamA
MYRVFTFAASAFLLLLFAGCAARESAPPSFSRGGVERKSAVTTASGSIPAPSLPPQLTSPVGAPDAAENIQETPVAYTMEYSVEDSAGEKPGEAPAESRVKPFAQSSLKKEYREIIEFFEKNSGICRLAGTPPANLIGLEQRLIVSLREGRDILRSLGYYAGSVSGFLDMKGTGQHAAQALIRISFAPGGRYAVGRTTIRESRSTTSDLAERPSPGEDKTFPPVSLADVGLPRGAPAIAADILAAVNRLVEAYHDNGYPFAATVSARYSVDHERQTLEADILVSPGEFTRMGDVARQGAPGIKSGFVEAMRTWRIGQPWNASQVESFLEALRQSGLFQSIDAHPAGTADERGTRAVVTVLESAPERTAGGSLRYHSEFGPGLQSSWEHRNITGRGDPLRVEAPLWADMQELTVGYRLPFFPGKEYTFIAKSGILNQNLDAYALRSASASAGVERRFSPVWSGRLTAAAEGGSIKEPGISRREYAMFGLPASVSRSTVDNPLDAGRGGRLAISLAPYAGEFGGPFTVLRSRLDGGAFIPLTEEDRVILALRGSLGAVAGAAAARIPPSARFYSGGGGSVRGYAYQSLGPRDNDRKPLGGNSLIETSAEIRWKACPEWGMVVFIDGGAVIDHPFKGYTPDMRWGTGVGLRYYTGIGPLRLDLATPVNPRDDDASLQCYISIGQSF